MQKITEAASRTLTKPLSGLFKAPHRHAANIVSLTLCEKAISRLDLSAYKNPILIDMSPGICTWSAALHDALKPRAHILLEPEKVYEPWIADFQSTHPNTYWLPEHGDRWALYMTMFGLDSPPAKWPKNYPNLVPRTVPPEHGINTDIIFTGNLSESDTSNNRLLAQLIATIPRERWLMTFGRVRFLVWIRDETKVRYIPRTVASRIRATVMAEAVCDVTEVASSNTVSAGRGHPKASMFSRDADGNLVFEQMETPAPVGTDESPRKGQKEAKAKVGRRRKTVEDDTLPLAPSSERKSPKKAEKEKGEKEKGEKEKGGEEELELGIKQPLEKLIERVKKGVERGSNLKITMPLIVSTLSALQEHYRPTAQRISQVTELAELRELARELHAEKLTKQHAHILSILLGRLKESEKNHKESVRNIVCRLTEQLNNPATESTWIDGMEHPLWYYKDDLNAVAEILFRNKKLSQLDGARVARMGKSLNTTKLDDSLFESLERHEETAAPEQVQGMEVEKMIADYNKQWDTTGKDSNCEIKEDEIFSYEKKLLEFHRRKHEPITVQPSDFYPESPLALLDFTPKLLHPHLRNPDLNARDKTWETFNWLLRTLFLLRARTISSALATLAPGGEHILDNLAPGVHINPEQRTRTLTADELIEITRAWETWPFRNELLHLEEYGGGKKEAEVMTATSHSFRIKSLKLGRQ